MTRSHPGTILAVGIAAVDIINSTDGFPEEDSEVRALSQTLRRGGNATNTLCVLSQLGHPCEWAGCLAENASSTPIAEDLKRYRIDSHRCRRVSNGHAPTSYITLNRHNGSRTIVHYRDLDEYSFADFRSHDLDNIDWLHFEGRHVEQTRLMLQHARRQPHLRISLELEKARDDIETLVPYAHVLMCSRQFVQAHGFDSPETFLAQWPALNQAGHTQICSVTWGERGAFAQKSGEAPIFCPALELDRVVDSIGAGDTFNAGLIHAILAGGNLKQSLAFANQLAGAKCHQEGFENLTQNPLASMEIGKTNS
ncbi:MAG: PfkB family carbohydrate kinase [Gammaproteobacteria bacterium]|nr:PfkB family carbohydrate kinase [Gammaproteobacteria bacterium]MDH5799414.1 PfkB family carbohydrate kinase [Gammaproteobacteria bacterium]